MNKERTVDYLKKTGLVSVFTPYVAFTVGLAKPELASLTNFLAVVSFPIPLIIDGIIVRLKPDEKIENERQNH